MIGPRAHCHGVSSSGRAASKVRRRVAADSPQARWPGYGPHTKAVWTSVAFM